MHDQLTSDPEAQEGSVWRLYLSPEDLQCAVRDWPLGRFLILVGSPDTSAFSVTAAEPKEGRVDLSVRGAMEGKDVQVDYSAYAEDLGYEEKSALVKTVNAFFPYPFPGRPTPGQAVAYTLGVSFPK